MNKKHLTKNNKKAKTIPVNAFNLGGTVSSIASGVGSIVSAGLANAEVDTSSADNAIEAVNSYQPATSSLDALADSYNNLNMADTSYNHKDFMVSTGEGLANMGKAVLSGASAGATLGPWGAVAGAAAGLVTSGAGWLAGAAKAKSKADELATLSKRANLSVQEKTLAARDDIQENIKDNYMRNRVAYGGPLFNHSGNWTNGFIFINEGGSHEENPYEGVQVGVDNQGIPNLVEEGEVIYNDYVFSDRLKPTKKQLKDGGFNKKYEGLTFARIIEDLQKITAETPNDFISKNTLNDLTNRIINMQEEVRMKKKTLTKNKFPLGGWTDEDSAAREEEELSALWAAAVAEIQKKVDEANNQINNNVDTSASNESNGLLPEDPDAVQRNEDINRALDWVSATKEIQPKIDEANATIEDLTKSGVKTMGMPSFNNNTTAKFNNNKPNNSIKSNGAIKSKTRFNNNTSTTDTNFGLVNTIGMLAPTINSLASTIYNAAKPIDKSNLIAGKSHRQRPLANYSRINVTPTLELVDENSLVTPIINRGSAAAREAMNLGQTASQTLANLANITYNTQTAEGDARLKANQINYDRRQNYNKTLADIQRMNSAIEQAEFTSNAPIYQAIAEGDIRDAIMLEQLQQMKGEAVNQSLNNMTQGVADLTRQNIEWNWIKDNPEWAPYFNRKAKCGGMLTRRRK